LVTRSTITGQGVRTDPVTPKALVTATVYFVVASRSVLVVPVANNRSSFP
jgi:hypothetical protein